MGTVLQLDATLGSTPEQDVVTTQLGFNTTTLGMLEQVDIVFQQLFTTETFTNVNTTVQMHHTDVIYGSPQQIRQPQLYLNTYQWLNEFSIYPFRGLLQGREGTMSGTIIDLERKVPGGLADPSSGRIPQLEIPTKSAITGTGADDSNAGSLPIPFPVQTVVF